LNAGSSLTRDLSMLWLPSSVTQNLAGGPPLTASGVFEQTIGSGGRARTVTNSANTLEWTVPTGLSAATILVLISTAGSSSTFIPYETNNASIDYAPFSDGRVYSGAFAGARYVSAVNMPGGTSYRLDPYVVAARGSTVASSHATFVNGAKVGSSSQTFTLNSTIRISADGSAFSASQRTYLAAFWNRALSDDELFSLSRNPWQLFQPRKIWVPVSVAGTSLALSATPLSIAGTVSASGDLAYETALALSASPLALSGSLSTTGDLTITPAATLALSASPLAIAGTLATAGELDYLLPTLALSASPLSITGTLAPTGELAYELPTLALSASPLALSGTLTPSGDIDYQLPFALTASALAVSGTLSVSGDLSITDEIRLTLSASPLALAGALAVAGDLDYVVPTLVLSASPLALSGSVAVTGNPAAVVPFVLTASPITLTGAVDVTGEIGVGTRFDITADPIIVSGALGVSGEILASFTVAQPLSAAPTGRRVQTSGGRMNVQTTRRPTYRGGTR
jgi:hypothetical protein